MSLEEVISAVAQAIEVSVEDLPSTSRKRRIAHARAIVTYAAIRNLGYKGTEIAEVLSLSPPTVSQHIDKGKLFLDRNEELKLELVRNQKPNNVPHYKESLARETGSVNLVYTQYINRKHKRSGRLWQNRFFSTIIEKDICASYRLHKEDLDLYGRKYRAVVVHSDAHDRRP